MPSDAENSGISRSRVYSIPEITEYSFINDKLRDAFLQAREQRKEIYYSQGDEKDIKFNKNQDGGNKIYNIESDKEFIENYYTPINSSLKNIQFSNS